MFLGQKTLKILSDIQSLLEKYLASDNGTLTNRKLRHRIKKIVYILSGGGVNLKRTAAYAIEDQPVKQKPVSEKKAVIQRPVITLSHPLLTSFQNLKTAEELNDILVGVPSRCDELLIYLDSRLEVAQALFDTLSSKVEFASGETASKSSKILLTAKIRRKVSRFAEALKEIITPNLQNSTPSDEDCTEIKIEVTASKKRKELGSKSEDTFPSVQSVDDSTKEVRSNSNTSTESSKLTTYEDFIHSLREANSDTIIQLLQPFCADWRKILGLGCCKTRRSLKRALEALLSSENLQSHKSLIEQSLSTLETITMAAVQAHLESTHNSTNQAEHQTDAPKKKKQKIVETEEEAESHQGVTNNVSSHKHILFIGQLSYDTTSDDLLNYLKATGVEGDISVRILTDKETGKSRGAAFIDFFGGKRSLKRIMDLHHTMLKGRRINVEHTSKHHAQNIEENEQHALDTKHQRMQQKILDSEKIDNLLREYSHLNLGTKGGMIPDDHLMNRLYAMTVNEVKEVLEEYSQIQSTKNPNSSNGNLHLLRKLITKRDGGGSAVDQTRESSGIARGREEDHYVGENKKQRTDGFGKFRATDDKKDELSSASSVRVGSGGRGIVQGRGQSSEVFKVFQGRGRGR